MKRLLPLIMLLIISLCGCSVKNTSLECVQDTLLAQTSPAFFIDADIPVDAYLTASCKDGCCAIFTHDGYEVQQEIFAAGSLDEAFLHISGRTQLSAVCLKSYPYSEYRMNWIAAGENGTMSHCAKIFYDGTYCYSLVIQCPLERQAEYEEVFADLLAGSTIQAV